ncbi:MAG: prepilin-type N-terminal cleavage/methylation domain-containing protein [Pyrinomonadaceae bacterium]|nr:prepilin-type N-terminal cleavage/methylation domain-containing protein [Pyrinomonadaceae bacterium]
MSNKRQIKISKEPVRKGESGFTLIESVIAIFILTIGLIGTAAAITFALEFSAISRNVTSGKLAITSTIEEIESLRNSKRLEFKQIENVGSVDNTDVENVFNGFSNGFNTISIDPGPDGVNGTDDDPTGPTQIRPGFQRQITITNLGGSTSIKRIEVRIQYPAAPGKFGEITGVAYLNDEFRITR